MELRFKNNNNKYYTVRQVLKQEFKISNRLLLKLKKEKMIFLNNENTFLDREINYNDIISVIIDFNENNDNIVARKMNLNILFEDDYILILNKSAGMPVHPSMEHFEDSL